MRAPHFTVAISAAFALCAPAAARAQSAYDQLCAAAGGNCNVNVPMPSAPQRVDTGGQAQQAAQKAPKPTPPQLTMNQQITSMVAGSLIQSFLNGVFSSPSQDNAAAQAAAEAARQRQIELLRQRAEAVRGQRQQRELENDASMEQMRSALAEPFDFGAPSGAPPPVRLGEGGGTVGLFSPPENPFEHEPTEPPKSEVAERLARLAAENGDVAKLSSNLSDLERQFADARAQALHLKRASNAVVREFTQYEETVAKTVEEAKERAASMAFEGFLKLDSKALDALQEVRSNSRAWNTLVGLVREGDANARGMMEAASFANDRIEDANWLARDRNLGQDVLFLAKRLGGPYAEHGASILESAVAIRHQIEAIRGTRELSGLSDKYRSDLQELTPRLADLERRTREARQAVSRATGISTQDLKRLAAPDGPTDPLASPVPHPLD